MSDQLPAGGAHVPLLEVDHVVVQFGGVTAVNEAAFVAEAGQVTGLIGPNGAGKTTCFNVISGLQKPTRGKVRFRGRNVTGAPVHRRSKKGMGRTFQRLEAFGSLTVRDNVRVAHDIHRGLAGLLRPGAKDIDALLDRVGIAEYADERADSIPTGTARLLELARCLAGDPKLLLLDEPSSGLDESETDDFGDLLRDLAAEGRGILMVEHDMDLVMGVCDTIHVLDFGSVIASGTPADIRRDPAVQRAYLGYSDEVPASELVSSAAGAVEETRTDLQPVGVAADVTTVIPVIPAAPAGPAERQEPLR
ncbi:ABC transporter ATP-binding protein [Nocardioides marmotae]|uniref:ATP-binding cassette domain-containing protein n=1 Tax=Nocardioides marmotae TaxID=2663857 RepID=A0A6I3JCR2_9ACTN|nr:ABC transporter ATP-binding protein [Nocardioides marmotae]MCR6032252.1 ATP-binding cassette domain-containing protein [Gordonia jinghuaiqii]MBC9734827.1 ABC transporter ATP-binding protein [Nocardioides marmotae]MTB85928.1 ATP-binding cassette domain-containing protein [Nocardioides marmotae]MTB95900.1 ATP-binding cassette domain-containing protein [Nocardioides marmotae]QKE02756.1 ABC transporter ATP-binding protein [Nocardioides marmotae]